LELKQSNKDVLSFAYIVSHDLRAPLVSIKGFASELQYALEDIESVLDQCMPRLSEKERAQIATTYRKDVPEAMDFIKSSVDRMDGLINAVLVLSRLEHRELKPEPVDMRVLAKSILNLLARQIEQQKTVDTIGELPRRGNADKKGRRRYDKVKKSAKDGFRFFSDVAGVSSVSVP
jgi:signal transduction histidine kinase